MPETFVPPTKGIITSGTGDTAHTTDVLPGAVPPVPPAPPRPPLDDFRYRQLFEKARDASFLMDRTQFFECNQACVTLLGYPDRETLLAEPLGSLSPPVQEDGTPSLIKAREVMALAFQGNRHPFLWRFRRYDGTSLDVEVTMSPVDIGSEVVLHGVMRDATERKRFEVALRDTARGVSSTTGDAFFRSLVEYLSRALEADCAFIGALTGPELNRVRTTSVFADGQFVPNFEYALENTPCANVTSAIVDSNICAYTTGVQSQFPEDELLTQMGIDGYVGSPLFDSSGRILGLMAVMFRKPVDSLVIVESMLQVFAARASAELERRQMERARERTLAALLESEERFKSAFARSAIGMAVIGLDDRFIQANPALCEMLGYTEDELRHKTTASISNPDDLRELRRTSHNRARLASGEITYFQVEKRYVHKQGHSFWATVGVSLVHDAEGNLVYYITQVQDISERKRAEAERTAAIEELRRANEQLEARVQERTAELERDRALLEAVLRQMPAGVMVAEAPSGKLLLGNEQMTRILRDLNKPLGSIDDLSHLTLRHSDGSTYAQKELPIARTLDTGEVVQDEEINLLRGDGTRGVILFSSAPIHNEDGQVVAAVSTGQDITDRKQTEEALLRLHNELEMQVQERTAELERANSALQTEVQERKRAEQVSRGQTQALAHTLNSLTAQPDLETFLDYLMQAIRDVLQAHSVGIELYDPVRDHMIPRLSYIGEQLLTIEMLQGLGIAASQPAANDHTWQAVLKDPRPFRINDVQNDSRLIYREQFWEAGVRSVLVVPMLLGDRPVGYLFLNHDEPRQYESEETELARALAQQVVLALHLENLANQGEEAAVLSERNRLAREIHDTLAQGFAGILIHLQLAEAAMTRKPEKALPALIQARDLAKSSLAEARRSVLALRPTALENASLVEAVRRLGDVMTAGTSLRSRMEVLGAPCPLPDDTEEHLLRIAQEAVNNTIKYAEATEVSLTLSFDESSVTLIVRDNGVGFTPGDKPRGSGFGHVGMGERLDALQGKLTIHSAPDHGTEIIAVVPVRCPTGNTV